MAEPGLILVTGAGGGVGGVGGKVVALLRQRSAPTSSLVTSRGQQMSRMPSTRSNGCSSV